MERFTKRETQFDLRAFLTEEAPLDLFNSAALLTAQQGQHVEQMPLRTPLAFPLVQDPVPLLALLSSTASPRMQAYAVARLGALHVQAAAALHHSSEMVRYAAALGLRDSPLGVDALKAVQPLLNDESLYVRRAAAITAISLGDPQGITTLLATLDTATLDTTENYGDNLYAILASYTGVDGGLNKEAWRSWWQINEPHFRFPRLFPKNEDLHEVEKTEECRSP